ncbi:MAG: hypothetical protein COB15_01030 [Flavobacteriales bacterium]|nr:MAG: hypothetical protein COB15_01030 [Flavobacteriales bacterium]
MLFLTELNAQNFNVTNERTFSNLFNKHIDTLKNFHTSIKPFAKNEIADFDTIINSYNTSTNSGFLNKLTNENLIQSKGKKFKLIIDPIVNAGLTVEKNSTTSQTVNETAFGLNIQSSFGKKWSGQFAMLTDHSKYPSHIDALVQNKNISPGYDYSKNDQAFFGQANITFTADENFTFQLGYGKNFIGDGYRSLFLSDNANSYPYLKVTANIWRLKYMALYTNYQDIRNSDGNMKDYFQKLSTIHYLSINATKWWNIGLFESIIWQSQEEEFYRGYDINYFNPVIFLRPTEYAQGSSDNALLGGSMKFKIRKKNILYSQLILDEFKLDEIKAGTGWWANKYGYQFGLKSYDFMWIKNLTLQLEYNMVRPFTYTHSDFSTSPTQIHTLQSYTHFNSPLAHPLGANFNEAMASLTYQKKRWLIEAITTIAKIGLEINDTASIGQDLYIPNNNRANEYGNYTTQGLTTDIINSTLKVSYIINPKSQLLFQVGVTNRMYKNSVENTSTNMVFVGIKTAITNRYFDF